MNLQRFALPKDEALKWAKNTMAFLAPLGVIYFGSVVSTLQTPNHPFQIHDLIPNNFVIGAMVLYITNVLFDYSRKVAGK